MNVSIVDYLRVNGEKLEAEIAKALQMPIALVQTQLAQLSSAGDVICCKVTRYGAGKKIEGTSYRLAGTRGGKPLAPAGTARTR